MLTEDILESTRNCEEAEKTDNLKATSEIQQLCLIFFPSDFFLTRMYKSITYFFLINIKINSPHY